MGVYRKYSVRMGFCFRYAPFIPVVINLVFILLYTDVFVLYKYSESSYESTEGSKDTIYETRVVGNASLLYFTDTKSFASLPNEMTPENRKIILIYNMDQRFRNNRKTKHLYKETFQYKNCLFTRDRRTMAKADAIVFTIGTRNERMGEDPPISPSSRNPNQVWIYTSESAPDDYFNADYQRESWRNTMNWSSFYRLDSDIPKPFGILRRQPSQIDIDYEAVYKAKTRNALFIVRQCTSASVRRRFIEKMGEHGFEVDSLGECGIDGEPADEEELARLIPKYKFYLALETSLCSDYVTNIYFRNFNHNWIMVVRGGANYGSLLPKETYIDTSNFNNIPNLVNYLNALGNDKDAYINFLRSKNQYTSMKYGYDNGNNEICRRLNNLPLYMNSHESMADFIDSGQCKRPTDI